MPAPANRAASIPTARPLAVALSTLDSDDDVPTTRFTVRVLRDSNDLVTAYVGVAAAQHDA